MQATHTQTAAEKIHPEYSTEWYEKQVKANPQLLDVSKEYFKKIYLEAENKRAELASIIQLHAINPAVRELEKEVEAMRDKLGRNTNTSFWVDSYYAVKLERDQLKQQLADSESARARAVEALKVIWADIHALKIEWFEKQDMEGCVAVIKNIRKWSDTSTQPPIKTVDEQDTTSTCPVCGRTAKEGCVGWHPTEQLLEETK